ncbi:MAG: tryptophan--tRNA ligase [Candidatus Omnitrophica bacterium]|nr:tryptophan--tRNA ligase [Candidatus Omnitrophota bacterium]
MKERILSGMRPTGALHLGHLLGALQNWVTLQNQYECFFMVADWHALMSEYEDPKEIRLSGQRMVVDWLACGIDPEKSVIFRQSDVSAHLELAFILGVLTPLSWLERNPTYKEQLRELSARNLTTYGFLGYPILQAADILLYRAAKVPIGVDQLAHLELAREIVRKFNSLYGGDLVEPMPLLTQTPKLLGIDGRKMSKSYDNSVALGDEPEAIFRKAQKMFTDPKRIKMTDPGHPDQCNVYSYYKIFTPERHREVYDYCSNAKKGCTDCKKDVGKVLADFLGPIRERRNRWLASNGKIEEILQQGAQRARSAASETINQVKKMLGI